MSLFPQDRKKIWARVLPSIAGNNSNVGAKVGG